MANPSNRGIGTGSAQIFDTSRIDDAMNRLAGIKANKDAMYAEGQEKARQQKDKAIAELQGQFADYDTNKLLLADVPEFQLKVQNINNKYDGKWGDILKGDPQLANQYRADLDEVKRFIARSVDAKPKAQQHLKEITGNPLYSENYKKSYIERATAPGYNFDEDLRNGLLSRDTVRPDYINNLGSLFQGKGSELYDEKDISTVGKDGRMYAEKSKVWKSDDEAFPKFKTTVGSDIEAMTDINLKYSNLPQEERMKAAYDDYKQSTEIAKKEITFKAAPEDKDGEGKDPYAGISVAPYEFKGEKGFNLGGAKGLQPTNFSYQEGDKENVVFGTPSEVYKGKDGEYRVRIVSKKETFGLDGKSSWIDTGEVKTIKLNKGGKGYAAFKNTYGKTPDEMWKEAYPSEKENTPNNDPLGLFK